MPYFKAYTIRLAKLLNRLSNFTQLNEQIYSTE